MSPSQKREKKLIEKQLATIAEVDEIAKWLTDAKRCCDRRNHLAHGAWWRYHVETSVIEVRWWDKKLPEFESFTLDDICEITGNLKAFSSELYKLQRAIEDRRGWHDFDGPSRAQ
jgi:hypothetical protein